MTFNKCPLCDSARTHNESDEKTISCIDCWHMWEKYDALAPIEPDLWWETLPKRSQVPEDEENEK